jgi:uncharacterized protein (DUF58 family)
MNALDDIKLFTYQIGWRSRGRRPGSHNSTQQGLGMEFRGHTTLLSYPDPRRIDIRQTIRDPLEQIYVRLFNQKSATPVIALCDLSGSMNFGSYQRKLSVATDIIQSIAKSANHSSDPFTLIGFDDEVREDWHCPASFRPHHALEMAAQLREYHPSGKGSKGLFDVGRFLPRERSLIFLISDFHMPLADLEAALALMLRHHIVPIVLWDEAEYKKLPEFGIASVNDPETGARRTLFLRKRYRERIISSFENRREAIRSLFLRLDMPPLFIEHGYDADMLTDYFHQYVAA